MLKIINNFFYSPPAKHLSSSARYRHNIDDLPLGLAALDKLRPVSFDWKDGQGHDLGFVAEEVAAVNPILATYRDGEVEGVKYKQLTAVLVNAVKEQQAKIETQQVQIETQQQQIAALTAELKEYRTLAAEVASLGLVVARRD